MLRGTRPTRRPKARRAVAGCVALVAVLAGSSACGGGADGTDGPCGPVQRERLDPRAVHVLPGADDPGYQTDPPTSGPHLPSPSTEDVRSEPVPPPVQVGLLEEGAVLVQHVGLGEDERAAVEALAGDGVVVAPADDLPDGAAVVATAWVTKQACDAVDTDVLEGFVDAHLGGGPGAHP